jgi:hypothetical protein
MRLIKNPPPQKTLKTKIISDLERLDYNLNFLVLIDTHAVSNTGAVVFGGSPDAYASATIDKVSQSVSDWINWSHLSYSADSWNIRGQ